LIEVPPVVSETLSENPAERILLGHITGVSGLQGWVKVHSDTNPRNNIVAYKSWALEQSGTWTEVKVVGGRPQGKTIVAQLEGVSSPEQASALIGARIAVSRSALPELGDGEYYWADLTGMHVKTVDGVDIGPVNRLFETGANDVVIIDDHRGERQDSKEVLVPWLVPDVITDVDMNSRVITIDWDPDF
jgi:16S rRNA processing protein RimM